jgi:hypothetical protein
VRALPPALDFFLAPKRLAAVKKLKSWSMIALSAILLSIFAEGVSRFRRPQARAPQTIRLS